jgi:hypothetical protein
MVMMASSQERARQMRCAWPGEIGAYTIRAASSWVGKRPFGVS